MEAGIRGITLDTKSPSELNGKLQSFCDVLGAAAEKNAPQTRRGKKKRYWSEERKRGPLSPTNRWVFFNGRRPVGLVLNTHCLSSVEYQKGNSERFRDSNKLLIDQLFINQ